MREDSTIKTIERIETSYFTLCCRTCGRRMRVPLSLMGEAVSCQHCSATQWATSTQLSRRDVISPAAD